LQLDSASPFVAANLASILYFTRQADRLIAQANSMLSSDPNLGHIWLGRGYMLRACMSRRFLNCKKGADSQSGDGLAQLGYTYAMSGRKSEAMQIANELEAIAKRRYSSPTRIACIYAALATRTAPSNGWKRVTPDDLIILRS